MEYIQIILIGIVLALDAFAVSICQGLNMKKITAYKASIIALFFGGFQALMPLMGYLLGNTFIEYISEFDHWIAFGLLLLIGGKMIFDGIKNDEEDKKALKENDKLDYWMLFLMAVATSIDALAVGITLSIDNTTNIWIDIAIIGIVTFAICIVGVYIGKQIGNKHQNIAQIIGGIVLILIGVKIVLEHSGVLNF